LPEASKLAPDPTAFVWVFKVLSLYFGECPVMKKVMNGDESEIAKRPRGVGRNNDEQWKRAGKMMKREKGN